MADRFHPEGEALSYRDFSQHPIFIGWPEQDVERQYDRYLSGRPAGTDFPWAIAF